MTELVNVEKHNDAHHDSSLESAFESTKDFCQRIGTCYFESEAEISFFQGMLDGLFNGGGISKELYNKWNCKVSELFHIIKTRRYQ